MLTQDPFWLQLADEGGSREIAPRGRAPQVEKERQNDRSMSISRGAGCGCGPNVADDRCGVVSRPGSGPDEADDWCGVVPRQHYGQVVHRRIGANIFFRGKDWEGAGSGPPNRGYMSHTSTSGAHGIPDAHTVPDVHLMIALAASRRMLQL